MRLILLSAILVFLSACTERSGCPEKALGSLGLADGEAGLAARLPMAQCELSEAQRDEYYAARGEGLKRYCDAGGGFTLGLAGDSVDPEVCPLDLRKQFRSAWRAGSEIAKLEKSRQESRAEAKTLEQTADGVEGDARKALLDRANALLQDARQNENDLEALRGLATVEGWQQAPAIPKQAFPEPDR